MGAHALLSPSGASRWLACPPSARFEEQFPSSTSEAAEEGTLAHSLAELLIKNHFKQVSRIVFNRELAKIKAHKFFNKEMEGHCMDYANFIIEKHNEAGDAMLFIEERIDLSEYVPEGFGTGDAILISHGVLDLNDLKYGKGVLVEAHENKQMMLYALGSLKKYMLLYEINTVRMTIYQPRLGNISSYELPAKHLFEWGVSHVVPTAKLAFEGKGKFSAGSHCKFCKARNHCKSLADHNMQLAKHAFDDPNKLTDEAIAEILEKSKDFKAWLSSVEEYALKEALNGKQWKGFKLVAGKSNRIITDEEGAKKAFKKAKIKEAEYLVPAKLASITTLEKNIGKDKVYEIIGKFVIKPQGTPALVPEWDKRPAMNSNEAAKTAFDNIE